MAANPEPRDFIVLKQPKCSVPKSDTHRVNGLPRSEARFEEILGGQVIDETGLPGIYGFELKQRVNAPEAFIQLLGDEAGLAITREQRETPTIVVRVCYEG